MKSSADKHAVNWQNKSKLIEILAKLLKQRRLTLVVGAGISIHHDLPDWGKLIESWRDELPTSIRDDPKYPAKSLPNKAQIILSRVYNNDRENFHKELRSRLYKNFNSDMGHLIADKTLISIGSLVMASSRGGVSDVITFNFDDVLETYLSYYGFTVESITEGLSWRSTSDVRIHHPHGLIRSDTNLEIEGNIVITNDDFISITKQENFWWKKISSLLSESVAIYIGVSGDDDHLERQLHNMHTAGSVAARSGFDYIGIRLTPNTDDAASELFLQKNILPVKIPDYQNGVSEFLLAVCKKAAGLR